MDKKEKKNNDPNKLNKKHIHPSFFRLWRRTVVGLMILTGVFLVNCQKKEEPKLLGERSGQSSRAISVSALPAKKADFYIYLTGLGTVTPVNYGYGKDPGQWTTFRRPLPGKPDGETRRPPGPN